MKIFLVVKPKVSVPYALDYFKFTANNKTNSVENELFILLSYLTKFKTDKILKDLFIISS